MKSAYLAGVCLLSVLPTLGRAQSGSELQYAESGRPRLLNPHINPTHTGPTDRLLSMIYEPLFRWNTDKEEFESVLARDIKKTTPRSTQAQNRAYIIKLKEGVRWHNGQAFTAADVVFTYNFIKKWGRDEDEKAVLGRQIVTIEKDGATELQLYLELKPATLGALDEHEALQWRIIPANRFQNFQPLRPFLQDAPIGTGPYRWADTDGDSPRLVANPTYHDSTKASLSPIISKEYTDAPTVASELLTEGSRLGLVVDLPTSQFNAIEAEPTKVIVERLSSYKIHELAIRQWVGGTSPMNNIKVRQAIAMAIDRAKLLRTRFSDKGKLMSTPYAPNSSYFDATFEGLPFDREKATQTINDAGLRGYKLRLIAEKTRSINKQRDDDVLQDLREQLEAIGLKVAVTQHESGEFERLKNGEPNTWDVALVTIELDAVQDISKFFHSKSIRPGGYNFMQFKDAEVDNLFDRASGAQDDAERKSLYVKAGRLIGSKVPAVFLVNEEPVYAYKRRFQIDRDDVDQFDFFTYAQKWRLRPRR